MGLTWRDRVCNGEVLQKASMESVEAMLVKSQKLRYKDVLKRYLKAADMDADTLESDAKNRPFGGKRSLMLATPLKEREKRSTWKDGGKDTPVIQLN